MMVPLLKLLTDLFMLAEIKISTPCHQDNAAAKSTMY
jgi:hypothetical protein